MAVFAASSWLCAADAPLGEEAVVLPLLGENNSLSGGTGLRVGVSSAGKTDLNTLRFTNSDSNCKFLTFIWDVECEI